ncbi:hypothetical protein BSP75_14955 [Aeromonas sp. YN13HZO-058]|nr:hypothetical protein BSP75_14955 [Aeromonas sp. YN13HZO-058]
MMLLRASVVESAPSGAKCEHYMGSCSGMPPCAEVTVTQIDGAAGEGAYLALAPAAQDVPVAAARQQSDYLG